MALTKPPAPEIKSEPETEIASGPSQADNEVDLLIRKRGEAPSETYISFDLATGEVDRSGAPILKTYRVTSQEYARLEAAGIV